MIYFFKVFLKANLWRDLFIHLMSSPGGGGGGGGGVLTLKK